MAITLDIVTPERRVLSVTCDEVRAPGVLGGFGVRKDHEHHYAVGGGFLQVADNKVIVLADTAEAAADIDVERARHAFQEAQERLLEMTEQDENHPVESARVRRAAARLGVAGK